ncbi:MAG: ribonuclease III [Rhizobiales bacterium 63-22]|nr:MAG: ribonuclease III [Rhizobiales bacterium 63-22]
MDETPNLRLPYILPSQAQKHVTHNEALRLIDAVLHLSVVSRRHTAPPETPAGGERYIVAPSAAGVWSGREGAVAAFIDGGWLFASPVSGWLAYIEDEAEIMVFDGAQWNAVTALPESLSVSTLGVGATADAVNRLAVSSPASLFNNAGAGHQVKVNKQAEGDTASLLFQSGWTGHAEMGLNGGNDFSIKVGDDAGQWREALRVDRATGNVAIGGHWPTARLDVDGPVRPAAYARAALPSAAACGAGSIAFVTDSGTGGEPAYFDGGVWRSFRTGAAIS